MHAVRRFMLEFIEIVILFFHANPWKGDTARQYYVKRAKSAFVRQAHRVPPES